MIKCKINIKILQLALQILLLFSLSSSLFALDSYKTTAVLNLRSGPGLKYKSLGSIQNGKFVNVIDKTSPLWYRVEYGRMNGYLSSKYLIQVPIVIDKSKSTNNNSKGLFLTGLIAVIIIIIIILIVADKRKPIEERSKDSLNSAKIKTEIDDHESITIKDSDNRDIFAISKHNDKVLNDYAIDTLAFTSTIDSKINNGSNYIDKKDLILEKWWVPKGREITLAEYRISCGLIYYDNSVEKEKHYSFDNSLIVSDLPVDSNKLEHLNYRGIAYSQITPGGRAFYLDWLAKGRRSFATEGVLYLFLCGLERRIIMDNYSINTTSVEVFDIITELDELIRLYGNINTVFLNNANNFLRFIQFKYNLTVNININQNDIGNEVYLQTRDNDILISIGQLVKMNKPLPADWAFIWVEWKLKTMTRCRNKVMDLFKRKYLEMFSDGLIVKHEENRKLIYKYFPVSNINHQEIQTEIPNISSIEHEYELLEKIYKYSVASMEAYGRFIARNPDKVNSLEADLLLPKELFEELHNINSNEYFSTLFLNNNQILISISEVLKNIPIIISEAINKKNAVTVAQYLNKFNISIIPDIRFDEILFEKNDNVLLYKPNQDIQLVASREYMIAIMIINLSLSISNSDGIISTDEENALEKYIQKNFNLSSFESSRLDNYVKWLSSSDIDLRRIKKLVKYVTQMQRVDIVKYLVQLIYADGIVHPNEIIKLKQIYRLFQLDENKVIDDIHKYQMIPNDEPVKLTLNNGIEIEGFKIPQKKESTDHQIDEEIIRWKIAETEKVQAILSEIFIDQNTGKNVVRRKIDGILGLDENHTEVLLNLIDKSKLSQKEFQEICDLNDVLPSGAIETINNQMYEHFNEALIEEEDIIIINLDIAKEIKIESSSKY